MIFKKKPQIIMTAKTYIDGNLDKETAWIVEDEFYLWKYVLPILMALVIFHQMVMR